MDAEEQAFWKEEEEEERAQAKLSAQAGARKRPPSIEIDAEPPEAAEEEEEEDEEDEETGPVIKVSLEVGHEDAGGFADLSPQWATSPLPGDEGGLDEEQRARRASANSDSIPRPVLLLEAYTDNEPADEPEPPPSARSPLAVPAGAATARRASVNKVDVNTEQWKEQHRDVTEVAEEMRRERLGLPIYDLERSKARAMRQLRQLGLLSLANSPPKRRTIMGIVTMAKNVQVKAMDRETGLAAHERRSSMPTLERPGTSTSEPPEEPADEAAADFHSWLANIVNARLTKLEAERPPPASPSAAAAPAVPEEEAYKALWEELLSHAGEKGGKHAKQLRAWLHAAAAGEVLSANALPPGSPPSRGETPERGGTPSGGADGSRTSRSLRRRRKQSVAVSPGAASGSGKSLSPPKPRARAKSLAGDSLAPTHPPTSARRPAPLSSRGPAPLSSRGPPPPLRSARSSSPQTTAPRPAPRSPQPPGPPQAAPTSPLPGASPAPRPPPEAPEPEPLALAPAAAGLAEPPRPPTAPAAPAPPMWGGLEAPLAAPERAAPEAPLAWADLLREWQPPKSADPHWRAPSPRTMLDPDRRREVWRSAARWAAEELGDVAVLAHDLAADARGERRARRKLRAEGGGGPGPTPPSRPPSRPASVGSVYGLGEVSPARLRAASAHGPRPEPTSPRPPSAVGAIRHAAAAANSRLSRSAPGPAAPAAPPSQGSVPYLPGFRSHSKPPSAAASAAARIGRPSGGPPSRAHSEPLGAEAAGSLHFLASIAQAAPAPPPPPPPLLPTRPRLPDSLLGGLPPRRGSLGAPPQGLRHATSAPALHPRPGTHLAPLSPPSLGPRRPPPSADGGRLAARPVAPPAPPSAGPRVALHASSPNAMLAMPTSVLRPAAAGSARDGVSPWSRPPTPPESRAPLLAAAS